MNLHFFTIPAYFPEDAQQLLNDFCAQHRVISIEKQFVDLGVESYWSCVVSYMQGNVSRSGQSQINKTEKNTERIDYKKVLSNTIQESD